MPNYNKKVLEIIDKFLNNEPIDELIEKISKEELVENIIAILEGEEDEALALYALSLLAELSDRDYIRDHRTVEPLLKLLVHGPDKYFRIDAAYVLGQIGDTRSVEPLIQALQNDYDAEASAAAATGLGWIGDPRAIEPLIEALRCEKKFIRPSAADALGCIDDPRTIQPLIDALTLDFSKTTVDVFEMCTVDNLVDCRKDAIKALGNKNDLRAVEALGNVLNADIGYKWRVKAAIALGKTGHPAAIELLNNVHDNSEKKYVERAAWDVLRNLNKTLES